MSLKKLASLLLALCLFGSGFSGAARAGGMKKYSASFYDAFDTVTQLIGYAESEAAFQAVFQETKERLLRYHRIFDAWNAYDGVSNLYFVNQNAGKAPVRAEPELIELLSRVMEMQRKSRVNVAMGAVLSLWHQYRTEGVEVPPKFLLQEKNNHVNIGDVVVDTEEGTVFFKDPMLSLDLGAVAKGYAVEKVASGFLEQEMPSFILNAGGNVRCGDPPADGRSAWGVAIQDPGGAEVSQEYLDILYVNRLSVVTSGDYQRYYEVDGVRYHHIIDPDTLMPSRFSRSVTVVTRNSARADFLSTALFLMPVDEGIALVESLEGVEAYWVDPDGGVRYTEGLRSMLRSEGAR